MMQSLPQEVLVLVLRHVNQAERLSSCARVSKAWARAAATATDVIAINTSSIELFQPWLRHHGAHVTNLRCKCLPTRPYFTTFSTLPCKNLLELTLEDCEVLLCAMEDSPGILQAATGLTFLDLYMSDQEDLIGGLPSLTALHALPALARFDLYVREDLGLDDYTPSVVDELPSGVISGLTTLTRLQLSGVLALESLQPFSHLTKLQHLDLDLKLGVVDAAEAVQLGQQPFRRMQALTCLILRAVNYELVSTSSSPAFSGCSGLQDLRLFCSVVDASAFKGLTELRELELWIDSVVEGGATGGVDVLLRHIASMQHLQHLVLGRNGDPVTLDGGDAELCIAVTANAHLKTLDLSGLRLPSTAWMHLFPPGRRYLQLQRFEVRFAAPAEDGFARELFDSPALVQLVDCCPALTGLSSDTLSLFKRHVSLVPLLKLQQLARLECPYARDASVSVGVLAHLSSLTRLAVHGMTALTDIGLLQLTALKGLQEVALHQDWRDRRLSVLQGRQELQLQATHGRRPDVWYQLLLVCAGTAECQATISQQLPGILQQLQDSGHGTKAFDLAREVGRARAREAEIEGALKDAKVCVAAAKAQLVQQLEADLLRSAAVHRA